DAGEVAMSVEDEIVAGVVAEGARDDEAESSGDGDEQGFGYFSSSFSVPGQRERSRSLAFGSGFRRAARTPRRRLNFGDLAASFAMGGKHKDKNEQEDIEVKM